MFYSDVKNEDNQDNIFAGKSTESCTIEMHSTSTQGKYNFNFNLFICK